MQGKQAKIVSPTQERAILGYLETTRSPVRDRVMFLLSLKAGLRAKEMASLPWAMVTDAEGQVAEAMHVTNRASKGKTGGRTMPMHPDVHAALDTFQTWRGDAAGPDRPVIFSERGGGWAPATVRVWGHRLSTSRKMDGCASHSGRRTCIIRAARNVSQGGGSLWAVQARAGPTRLAMTQRSLEGDGDAKRQRIPMILSGRDVPAPGTHSGGLVGPPCRP
jgi:integrase/recombinase XerC